MTNFIFKSQGLIKNVVNKLEIIQSELRHQRSDNQQILFLLNKLLTAKALQKQVDDYYEADEMDEHLDPYQQSDTRPTLHPRDVTSPQTDTDEQ